MTPTRPSQRAILPLTFNLGLRYDLQFLETISTDTNNVSPRIGFAWSPFESRRTVIRGSYGLFYDRVPLRALANALLSAGNTTDLANLSQSNAGEFFFSSPIDNFNIWKDYGRSDDDQRHRVVFNGTVQTGMGKADTLWERISRGFQLSTILQFYSALPFNITAGSTTIQGTAARPAVNGSFIDRNAGTGFDFFTVNARLSRVFPVNERVRLEALAEAFNALNHVNGVTLNGVFGSGAYPTNPSPTFMRTTAVGDPRSLQLAIRLTF
jgi:hypothetical protein